MAEVAHIHPSTTLTTTGRTGAIAGGAAAPAQGAGVATPPVTRMNGESESELGEPSREPTGGCPGYLGMTQGADA